jgi:Na+/H+-dicarboxylate symporter/ABC-type amino acid transport substrate-binding protein
VTRATTMTFSQKILAGLAAGIAVGLFLGELVGPLSIVADGFVKLLQMTVLPYVTVSIIVSVGSLDFAEAKRLGLRAGAVIAGLWLVALIFTFLFPLVFPPSERASFFSAALLEKPPPFDFVGLYIPSNPFHSLANNIVPAVVLFSIMVGVALIGTERKGVLLDVLGVASATIARATRFVVRLTPYGVFALAATAAGTLHLEQVQRIQVYLITYVAISLLVALWVLPGLVAALTPIPYREVLGPTRDAIITAFVAGDLFIVLPILIESCKDLLARFHATDDRSVSLPDVLVPASFNFPHTGKLLSLSFILFAGWFSDAPLPMSKYPRLALTGLLSFFGSLNSAVPFLLDAFRVPAETFQLFIATGVINARFGSLTAAVHTIAVALLGSAAIAGSIRFDSRRLLRYAITTAILTAFIIGGLRLTFRTLLHQEFKGAEIVFGMTNALEHDPTRVVESRAAVDESARPVLDAVRARGLLRVGFSVPRLPYVFRNAAHDLVGLDVELAHILARDLSVDVAFVEWQQEELVDSVSKGECDIGIGGNPVTPRLATISLYSEPYLDETAAFVVKDHLRSRFETWESIRSAKDLVIGIPALPYYERLLRARLPDVPLKTFVVTQDPLDRRAGFDAVALPAERGSVQTLLHPGWTVVVPQPDVIKVPVAFPLARHDQAWANFVNMWIEMKRRDGTLDTLYNHWILGRDAQKTVPRWSVIRNVLHWVD